MNRRLFTAAGLTAVLLLTGCTSPQQQTEQPSPSSTLPTLGAEDEHTEDEDMLIDPDLTLPVPQWSPELHASAIEAATAAMIAWARPDLPYDAWWQELAEHLTPGAQEVVSATEPAYIPVSTVGLATLPDEGETAYLAWVSFDTNAGTWWVLLAWQNDGTWLADRITQSHEVSA